MKDSLHKTDIANTFKYTNINKGPRSCKCWRQVKVYEKADDWWNIYANIVAIWYSKTMECIGDTWQTLEPEQIEDNKDMGRF